MIAELIEINNDRIAGFQKVIANIDDKKIDLKSILADYAEQSGKHVQQLSAAEVPPWKTIKA